MTGDWQSCAYEKKITWSHMKDETVPKNLEDQFKPGLSLSSLPSVQLSSLLKVRRLDTTQSADNHMELKHDMTAIHGSM